MITVHTVTYNEELILPFMIKHYRDRFPNCHIVVNDNMSKDNTVKIAEDNNCEVRYFDTNETIDDLAYLKIKNEGWKTSKTDWVLVCDVDELLDIDQESLIKEAADGVNVITPEAYNMINMFDNYDLESIDYGSRCNPYDKNYLFNKKIINSINYEVGCHKSDPQPKHLVKYNSNKYLLYHYKCVNPEFMYNRYKTFSSRLSEKNKKSGWGNHYNKFHSIKQEFELWRQSAIKIRDIES